MSLELEPKNKTDLINNSVFPNSYIGDLKREVSFGN